jgi:ketosteroid isomerase-like protein
MNTPSWPAILLAALTTASWFAFVSAEDQKTTAPPTAGKAIRQVLDAQVAAWNKGDLAAFMEGYWQSKELSFFSGNSKTHGWQATLDRYRKKYQGQGREMGKLSFREIEIEVLSADHALVKGRWHLALKKDTAGGLFTLIFRRLPVGWRIVHDHTSS